MPEYTFFAYEANEALHLSSRERDLITDCLNKIDQELDQLIDKHTRQLLHSNIELLLNYCTRFYDRQFITRTSVNQGVLARFESLYCTTTSSTAWPIATACPRLPTSPSGCTSRPTTSATW